MEELTQAEVYSPPWSHQVCWTLWNWLTFFFHIFYQILKALGHLPLLSTSSSSPHHSFKPLSVIELPELDPTLAASEAPAPPDSVDRLTVVLDLDETLVCAYETSSLPASLRARAVDAGLAWFDLKCVSSDKGYDGKHKISYVTVFERPGLREFLKQLSLFSDLILFTAGLEGYAKPLVDKIDVENLFSLRLYRPSTITTEYRDHVKDLSRLSKDMNRTVIVDNNPFSFLLQPVNGIPCVPFSAGQPHDNELLTVILPLLRHLSQQRDVRPELYERFHMPEWFQKNGIPIASDQIS